MHWIVTVVALFAIMVNVIDSKPVALKPPPGDHAVEGGSEDDQQTKHDKINERLEGTDLPYDKYLREVVMALEEDPEFRKKLEESNVSDIKDGSVAKHIERVSHQIRTKLDEIKRREIFRLQELRRLQMKSMQGTKVLHYIAYHGGVSNMQIPAHLDIANPHSFEMKDLEQLIKQTTNDLEQLDKQRRVQFKEYEMEKEFEKQDRLNHLPEEERKKEQARLEEMKKKHADHPKIHHPGSRDQFEEVWEEKDHLGDQEFNPRTFFKLHDLDDDGHWGIEEVEAVLQSELGKVYNDANPEDDPMEKFEEMNRMREHIFTEMDKNKDARISQEEFLTYTGQHGENEEFKKDEGWKTVDEEEMFTDEEYQRFIQEHHAQPGEINMPPPVHGDPNVQHMQIPQGQIPQGQFAQGQGHNLQFNPNAQRQPPMQDFQQQQQQFAQQQQILQHQQEQFNQQQQVQQQLAQQHAQIQQQHLQQQQQFVQQQMGQQLHQQGQGQVPVQAQQPVQPQQGQVPVQPQQGQGQVPVQAQQGQVPVQAQQGQVPVQAQQGQVPVQAQQGQVPVQAQQGQVPVQGQQGQVPVQAQQGQGQQQAQGQQQQVHPTQ